MIGNIKKIGWIGTGVMGKSMCKHLLKNGYELMIFSRTKAKTEELIELGAKYMLPNEIAKECQAVFLMVGFPSDVEAIVLGEDGILKHMNEGSFLIDHTTSSPILAERIYYACEDKGIFSYDAPVSGGDVGARDGKLVVMCGGKDDKFEYVKEIMNVYSKDIRLMGGPGKGQHTKMANQVIIASTMVGVIEGLIYAQKAGLDLDSVISLLGGGAAGSFSLNVYGPRIVKRDFEPGFYIEHFVKDMGIALRECELMNIKLPGLELAHSLYKTLLEDNLGRKGTQGLYIALEKLNKLH